MKILHLFSDCRYTGPAQPVIDTCRGLMDRGHEVLLACREVPSNDRTVMQQAKLAGVPTTDRFHLNRYIGLTDTTLDVLRLPGFLRRARYDIVHTHLSHDHMLGAACLRLAAMGRGRSKLIRTLHRRNVLKPTLGNRIQIRAADGVVTFTPGFRKQYIERFGLRENQIGLVPPTIDTEQFDPNRGGFADIRGELGINPGAVVIGIVGRFQAYRRMDLFMEAARRVADVEPSARFLVVGRSSQYEQTVREPRRRFGLEEQVVLAGYRREDYIDTLAAMNVFTLLMPGSDGTARAVREALAMGRPCVVSDYGMLPELVPDGEVGHIVKKEPAALAEAWLKLIRDEQKRRSMGDAARRYAQRTFSRSHAVAELEKFYEQVLTS